MNKFARHWCLAAALSCTAGIACAQNTADNHVMPKPPAGIVVDGDLHEWGGDSLKYYNPTLMMGYALANDHDNIYIAVRIGDRSQQARVLNNGLTISINTKGKKKDTYSITFPIGGGAPSPSQLAMQQMHDDNNDQQSREEMMKAKMTSLRNIKVTGFKDVESDIITTSNTYGFKTAMNYDDKGYLLYEVAIPLKFFAPDDSKAGWAFDFKVNGFKQAHSDADMSNGGMQGGGVGRGGSRGGMGGGMGRGGGMRSGNMGNHSGQGGDMARTVDFWDKFYLQQ